MSSKLGTVGTAIGGAFTIWVLWNPLIAPVGRGMFTQRINPSKSASPDSVVQFFSAGTANMIGKGFENYDRENLGRRFDEPEQTTALPSENYWISDPRRYLPFLRPNPSQQQQMTPHNKVRKYSEDCPPDRQWFDTQKNEFICR